MKIDEAISILKQYIDYNNPDIPDFYTMEEACEVVINALEQQVTDAVDRVTIKEYLDSFGKETNVTLQTCEDCISRQAVIDTIDRWVKNMHVLIALPANEVTPLFESVHELPSVIPQQKMGRWIVLKDEFDDVCEAVCSCCDKNGNHKWAFCPFCGCKMQEVKDE